MKVLWLINILLPAQSARLNQPQLNVAGWITGMLEHWTREMPELLICSVSSHVSKILHFTEDGIGYLTVPQGKNLDREFAGILETHQPDLIHIFGTEYGHSAAMVRVADPQRTLVQVQGFLTWYATKFFFGLPRHFHYPNPVKNIAARLVCGNPTNMEYRRFVTSARLERETLGHCRFVLGHTDWDQAIAQQYAPSAHYFRFNETLRQPFYEGQWQQKNCRPYSIFVSQAQYPIKGFHMLLQALPGIIRDYPDTHVYVSGSVPRHRDNPLSRIAVEFLYDYYGHIMRTIRRMKLEDRVTFLGPLNAQEMKNQFLQANVFVSCSSIENESNSLSEAKILGVPCVVSYVGGVTGRITHGESGYFYPFNEPEVLRYYVGAVFGDPQLATKLSVGARLEAQKTNAPDATVGALIQIYRDVMQWEAR